MALTAAVIAAVVTVAALLAADQIVALTFNACG
ncbi:hypothetical protein SAMN05720354_12329 [Nitrosospira sp. Nsp1]|nr:hypothetical protein SAMN05720354_12329 [Nitrosospira sp. Nsp1]